MWGRYVAACGEGREAACGEGREVACGEGREAACGEGSVWCCWLEEGWGERRRLARRGME